MESCVKERYRGRGRVWKTASLALRNGVNRPLEFHGVGEFISNNVNLRDQLLLMQGREPEKN